ncbi:MAG: hypothetical protein COA57_04210 [Flavobacteriales bacterium]|nr:MAG: hypothetical protein COA57_04210 [Flavobacteriales bacterium]
MSVSFRHITRFFLLITFITVSLLVFAQNNNGNKEKKPPIEVKFSKYKSEITVQDMFFNVVKVTNNTVNEITFEPKFNLPDNWKTVIGTGSERFIKLDSSKTKYIPVRVALDKDVPGGRAYVISAELIDENGALITPPAYCYVNVPKIVNWGMSTPSRYIYTNKQFNVKEVRFAINNRGNSDELINLEFNIGKHLEMLGTTEGTMITGITIPPHTDTTLSFLVRYNPVEDDIGSFNSKRLSVKAVNGQEEMTKVIDIWFESAESKYVYEMREDQSPLVVDLGTQNLLSDSRITFYNRISGTILFKKERELKYFYNHNNVLYSKKQGGLGYFAFARVLATYKTRKYGVSVGDVSGGTLTNRIYGRGISGYYDFGNQKVKAAITRHFTLPITGVSATYSRVILPSLNGIVSMSYQQDNFLNIETYAPSIGGSYSFLKGHSIGGHISTASSNINATNTQTLGYAHNLYYNGIMKKLRVNVYSHFTSREYIGVFRGLNSSGVSSQYTINKKSNLSASYVTNWYDPIAYQPDSTVYEAGLQKYDQATVLYGRSFKKDKIYASIGPGFQNVFSGQPPTTGYDPFISTSYQFNGSVLVKGEKRHNSISMSVLLGYTTIRSYEDFGFDIDDPAPYFNSIYRLNARVKDGGFFATYFIGANSIIYQKDYLFSGQQSKIIRINPYYRKSFFDRRLNVSINVSLNYYVTQRQDQTSLYSYLNYDLGKGWSVNSNVSFYTSNRFDEEIGRQSYRGINLNLGIRKRFDLPQPRMKFYTLQVVFFKDLNGNRAKDQNEIGIANMLVDIQLQNDSVNYGKFGYFIQTNLLSDVNGEISYVNMPQGSYKISTTNLEGTGEFTSLLGTDFEVNMDKNTIIYVPYIMSNKVYGRIVLERDPYSSEGNIPVDNIKITASDTMDNSYSTLSDENGKFILYAPQAGIYTIKVNNVFGDNFEIERDQYVVDFNGLKEFHITFLFKEKKRKINFMGDISGFDFGGREAQKPLETQPAKKSISEITSELDKIKGPIDPSRVKFKVQVGVYGKDLTKSTKERIIATGNIEITETEQGFTRFTSGEFEDYNAATEYRRKLIDDGMSSDTTFIIVVGDYNGILITAEEAKELLKKKDE